MASSVFVWLGSVVPGPVTFSGAATFGSTATFGNYVINSGPFVTASGERWLHSEAGGGGGSVYENTCFGYDAGKALAGTCYANTLIGKDAGKVLNGTAPNAASNTMVGYGAGIAATTGTFNTLVGTATGQALTTQSGLTFIGYHAGINATGTGNSFLGNLTGRGAAGTASGIANTAMGDGAMTAFTAADSNAAFGISTLESLTSGDNNTALGSFALRNGVTTASGCIGVGYFAGAFETGSNKFFVNNVSRVNENGDRTLSLLYGVMGATAADQTLTCNGNFNAVYVRGSVGNALTAAGATRADALQLAAQINNITTAAAGTGVILPVGTVGMRISVFNAGANAVQVYASASETIDGTAGSTGVPLTNAKRCDYFFVAANTWISAQLGVISA